MPEAGTGRRRSPKIRRRHNKIRRRHNKNHTPKNNIESQGTSLPKHEQVIESVKSIDKVLNDSEISRLSSIGLNSTGCLSSEQSKILDQISGTTDSLLSVTASDLSNLKTENKDFESFFYSKRLKRVIINSKPQKLKYAKMSIFRKEMRTFTSQITAKIKALYSSMPDLIQSSTGKTTIKSIVNYYRLKYVLDSVAPIMEAISSVPSQQNTTPVKKTTELYLKFLYDILNIVKDFEGNLKNACTFGIGDRNIEMTGASLRDSIKDNVFKTLITTSSRAVDGAVALLVDVHSAIVTLGITPDSNLDQILQSMQLNPVLLVKSFSRLDMNAIEKFKVNANVMKHTSNRLITKTFSDPIKAQLMNLYFYTPDSLVFKLDILDKFVLQHKPIQI